eukprot:4773849-Karenia_brevis.AAC.1
MNEVRKGNDPKLHLGVTEPRAPTGPKAQPKVTSMNEMRRGKDPKFHWGMTGPREGPGPNLKPHP